MNKNFDATSAKGLPLHCIVCEREIADGNWFARIRLGDSRVAMCRPRCVERFVEQQEACARKFASASTGVA